jgi:hypothetical protein
VQNAPRRYRVHCMNDHQVMDAVARVVVDYGYPVVIRPWYEPPWRASNTIDVICAIQNGAPLSVIARSPELDNAAKMLQSSAPKQSQAPAQKFQQNLLAVNDIDPNDVDTARSPWDVEQWKQDHQLRLAVQQEALLPHSAQGWDDPDAPRRVIVNAIKILSGTTRQILQHPIDSLIIDPVKEFVGMFKPPKANPDREQARHDVLGQYYQSKDIDPNDLDTADHPGRAMQWADAYQKRHRNDRNPVKVQIPPPEDTEKILAMMLMFLLARKFGKAVRSAGEGLAEESAITAKRAAKTNPGNKKMPEVENPKPIEKLENKVEKEYGTPEKSAGPKTTTTPEDGYHARTSPEITQSVLDKIDPSRFSRDTRFGKAFYVADKGDVAVAEIAHHGATPTHMIRYKLDLSKAKVLDLTDPAVVKKWGSPGGNNYAKTQAIAKKAQEAGFDAIKFPSQRAGGNNIAIFDKFDEILSPQMVTPVK